MFHKTLAVKATTTTDQGEFTAIAAAYSVDRTNERIVPGAFGKSIDQWQASGKQIPLHWDHSSAPQDIIGTVDPAEMRETDAGLQVRGQLDLEGTDVAKEAWRLMGKNAVAFSFGYLVTDSAEAKDGVLELKALDLFEISVTPAPVNPDTRILSMKSLEARAKDLVVEMRELADLIEAETKAEEPEVEEELAESKDGPGPVEEKRIDDAGDDPGSDMGKPKAQDPLRRKAAETELRIAAPHLLPPDPPPAKSRRRSPGGVRRAEADRMLSILNGKGPDDEPA